MQLFMGHIVSSLYLLKERIFFFMCILNLVFLSLVCVFFSPPPKLSPTLFFPQLVLFFLFLQGEKSFFLNLCCSQGELLLFIGGVASISYRVELFCVPLIFFSLILYCECFLFNELSLSIRDKKGEIQMKCGNPVCFVYGEIH